MFPLPKNSYYGFWIWIEVLVTVLVGRSRSSIWLETIQSGQSVSNRGRDHVHFRRNEARMLSSFSRHLNRNRHDSFQVESCERLTQHLIGHRWGWKDCHGQITQYHGDFWKAISVGFKMQHDGFWTSELKYLRRFGSFASLPVVR